LLRSIHPPACAGQPVCSGERGDRQAQVNPPARFSSARGFRTTTSDWPGISISPSLRNLVSVRLIVSIVRPR